VSVEEPRIDIGQALNFFQRQANAEGISDVPDTFRAGFSQRGFDFFAINRFLVKTIDANFQSAQSLLQRLLEGTANGHDFTDRLHLRRQT
jgi:hypothetical protein